MIFPSYLLSVLAIATSVLAGGPAQSTAYVAQDKVDLFTKYTRYAFSAYYSDASAINNWSCPLCRDGSVSDTTGAVFTPSAGGTTQGYVAISPSLKSIIFVVRGSASIPDFIADLDLIESHIPLPNSPANVKIHTGFWETWEALRPRMEPVLADYVKKHPDYSVSFVGHSLGAAVSVLAAMDVTSRGLITGDKVHIVNMGQPRIGNPAFTAYLKSFNFAEVSRIVNNDDIVAHLPTLSAFYRHESTEYWINPKGRLVTCNDVNNNGEDTNCADTVTSHLNILAHASYFGVFVPLFQK